MGEGERERERVLKSNSLHQGAVAAHALLGGASPLSVCLYLSICCLRPNQLWHSGPIVILPVFSTLFLKEEEEGAPRGDAGEERSLMDPPREEAPVPAAMDIIECVPVHIFSSSPLFSMTKSLEPPQGFRWLIKLPQYPRERERNHQGKG